MPSWPYPITILQDSYASLLSSCFRLFLMFKLLRGFLCQYLLERTAGVFGDTTSMPVEFELEHSEL